MAIQTVLSILRTKFSTSYLGSGQCQPGISAALHESTIIMHLLPSGLPTDNLLSTQ